MTKSRRQFLSDASKIIAATGVSVLAPTVSSFGSAKNSPGDKIVLGLIGARGQGMADLRQALKQPGVECGAVCDIDNAVLLERSADIEKIQGKQPRQYKDFRKLLDNKDIDCSNNWNP